MTRLMLHQNAALYSPFQHTAMFGGVAAGKTTLGSHFAIHNMRRYPHLTGLIGANSYDQLSTASLRELFEWLDRYGIDYVIDKQPPAEWNQRRAFKDYRNVLSCLVAPGKVATVFTRVMSDSNPLRGIKLSWYWLDETRDTPEDTHDVVMSRLREDPNVHTGLITSTPNGEDWAFKRFVRGGNRKGDNLYGSMHIKTIEAVRAGIITQAYYDTLRRTYSKLMALQELEAEHVNVLGGQAYHAWGDYNRALVAPWGDAVPDRRRPLLIGCDFNFSPAPLVWVVSQMGPAGTPWEDCMHTFSELSAVQCSTDTMTRRLCSEYPGFTFECYGDASGGKGTTSNAGEHDYAQMANAFIECGAEYAIDYDQANPLVKNRVENVCSKMRNGMEETLYTYNPEACPLLDEDFKQVGWTKAGKLDDGGIVTRTHASDGLGYKMWKVMPFGVVASAPGSIGSPNIAAAGDLATNDDY